MFFIFFISLIFLFFKFDRVIFLLISLEMMFINLFFYFLVMDFLIFFFLCMGVISSILGMVLMVGYIKYYGVELIYF